MWDDLFGDRWNPPEGMPPKCYHAWVPYGLEGVMPAQGDDLFWELERCLVCDYPRYKRLPPVKCPWTGL